MDTQSELSCTRETWQGWHIINCSGKFVMKGGNAVRAVFEEIMETAEPKIAVDFSAVSQIDSSALAILLNLKKHLKEKNGKVVIIGPNAEINETFSIVGFSLAVPVYSTRAIFEKSNAA